MTTPNAFPRAFNAHLTFELEVMGDLSDVSVDLTISVGCHLHPRGDLASLTRRESIPAQAGCGQPDETNGDG